VDRATLRAYRSSQQRIRRDVGAIAAVFAGTLVVTVLACPPLLAYALLCLTGFAGALLLGAVRPTLGGAPALRDAPVGVLAAVVSLGAGLLLVFLAGAPFEGWHPPAAALLLESALLPAVVEEWLCRGVLWTACLRLQPVRVTLVVTAMLFTLMHVLAWGPFGIPAHFVAGLAFGAVRARTGSLPPCMLAHLLHNGVVLGFAPP